MSKSIYKGLKKKSKHVTPKHGRRIKNNKSKSIFRK
jgi:hypothetical protein